MTSASVHLFYGLSGSGKTTRARELAEHLPAVRFTLDEWMLRLYPDLTYDSAGYGERAEQVKELIWSVAAQVLLTGSDVLLDWNSWSRERRRWVVSRAADHAHRPSVHLRWLTTSTPVADARLAARAAASTPHTHAVRAAHNAQLADLMEPPDEDEGLTIARLPTG